MSKNDTKTRWAELHALREKLEADAKPVPYTPPVRCYKGMDEYAAERQQRLTGGTPSYIAGYAVTRSK